MADVEGLTHSGLCAVDLPESEDFYVKLLGARFSNRSGFHVDKVVRGRSLNTVVALADYLVALMVPKNVLPEPLSGEKRGANPFRHAFWVAPERFDQVLEELSERGVEFEGPVTHPENGPFGQSIYLKDPTDNFLEICWRRDRDQPYHPVTTTGKLAEH